MTPQTTAPWTHDPIGSAAPPCPRRRALADGALGWAVQRAGGEAP